MKKLIYKIIKIISQTFVIYALTKRLFHDKIRYSDLERKGWVICNT